MLIFCIDNTDESAKIVSRAVRKEDKCIKIRPSENILSSVNEAAKSTTVIFFIDTRLHGKTYNSFSLASSIRQKFPDCHIVFASQYQEDMPFCFKNFIRPSAFLLKPLAVSEVSALINEVSNLKKKKTPGTYIYVSTRNCKRGIEVGSILYFATCGKKLCCYLADGEKVEFYGTIAYYESNYSENFIRCHSGFLVNRQFIKGLKNGELELYGADETLPISRKYKAAVMECMT